MKKSLALMLIVVVMIALGLTGCREEAKSGKTSGEHPAKEHPVKAQPKSEHPTEHPS